MIDKRLQSIGELLSSSAANGWSLESLREEPEWFTPAGLSRGVIRFDLTIRAPAVPLSDIVVEDGSCFGKWALCAKLMIRSALRTAEVNDAASRKKVSSHAAASIADLSHSYAPDEYPVDDLDFRCSAIENTPELVENKRLRSNFYVKPGKSARFFFLDSEINLATGTVVDKWSYSEPFRV